MTAYRDMFCVLLLLYIIHSVGCVSLKFCTGTDVLYLSDFTTKDIIVTPQYPGNYITTKTCEVTAHINIKQPYMVQLLQSVTSDCTVRFSVLHGNRSLSLDQSTECTPTGSGYTRTVDIYLRSGGASSILIALLVGEGQGFYLTVSANTISTTTTTTTTTTPTTTSNVPTTTTATTTTTTKSTEATTHPGRQTTISTTGTEYPTQKSEVPVGVIAGAVVGGLVIGVVITVTVTIAAIHSRSVQNSRDESAREQEVDDVEYDTVDDNHESFKPTETTVRYDEVEADGSGYLDLSEGFSHFPGATADVYTSLDTKSSTADQRTYTDLQNTESL